MECFSTYSSEDEYNSTDESNDEYEYLGNDYELFKSQRKRRAAIDAAAEETAGAQTNLLQKLFNREVYGTFSGRSRSNHRNLRPYNKVPSRLRFCLKDLIEPEHLTGQMFMGVSACGQFLLSYKVACNDNVADNHYSFHLGYKYTLYFWIYQPFKRMRLYYKCCLFDDHGVDNMKEVTMAQWNCADPRVLIVHGAAEEEGEDSHITYVKVPKLGCLDCKKLRDLDDSGPYFRSYAFCLKCNLTVHTKYSSTESDRKFNAYLNLLCPERIIIVANGFVHMLHIDVDLPPTAAPGSTCNFVLSQELALHTTERRLSHTSTRAADEGVYGDNHNHVVARILADFSDIETDSTHSSGSRNNDRQRPSVTSTNISNNDGSTVTCIMPKAYDELVFTCNTSPPSQGVATTGQAAVVAATSSSVGSTNCSSVSPNKGSGGGGGGNVSLVSHIGKRHHRIVTKSYRNGITTVDMQGASNSSSSGSSSGSADKASAYEFSEDNEKCEKIAILRKRRLADKKYEFSEDNSENIIPFTKIRSASKSLAGGSPNTRNLYRSSTNAVYHHFHRSSSPCASPSSSPRAGHASSPGCDSRHSCSPSPSMHRGSPQGFRSPPCSSSQVGSAGSFMRSPNRPPATGSQCFKPLGTLSPLQLSMTKRNHLELAGSMSPNGNVPFLSPRREELRIVEVPLQGVPMPEKPVCTKKFKRRYVEEDDAASVITSEEDDCISPGYHTSLPMEVHGSCYSEMQMISQASYQQLRCPSVVITQHSFDIEAFTYYVLSALCQKHNRTYDVFYDWAYEPISVCPRSLTIICLLMAQFSARDQMLTPSMKCVNCSRKLNCIYHRRHYEGRILFTWNMESGDWEVLDYGEMIECKESELIYPIKRIGEPMAMTMPQMAKKLAYEMAYSLSKVEDHSRNLRVLDSSVKRSKMCVVDYDNMVELHLKRARLSD